MDKNEKNFDDLIDIMLLQAETFLKEIGEFFPYGSSLTNERQIETLGILDKTNSMDAIAAIEFLSEHISKSIKSNKILIGAIGVDVIISETRENGIIIKATDDGNKWHERTYAYFIDENGVTIQR